MNQRWERNDEKEKEETARKAVTRKRKRKQLEKL